MDLSLPEFDATMQEAQMENFEQYLGLLLKWNRTFNLTTITDPMEVYEKHFSDSATPLQFISSNVDLVDMGTGAGFPGIPIKILRPDIRVTLIEATTKKVNFCENVIRELDLKAINVINGRAEDENIMNKAGTFDVVISRATLKLPSFISVGSKYLNQNGKLVAMLGAKWSDDLEKAFNSIKKASLKLTKVHEYLLPMSQSKRALLIFENK